MEGAHRDKYSFIGEWYDNQSCNIRRFNIFYYPTDNTIEMFDLKLRKTFVRRMKVTGVSLENFYIGGVVFILGRLIKIVDFACEDSRKKLQVEMKVTFVLIKPIPMEITGKIIKHLNDNGLKIVKMKKTVGDAEDIRFLFRSMEHDPTYAFLIEYLTGDAVIGMEVVGKDAVNHCCQLIGDNDPAKAAPGTIRALYGTDAVKNCIHSSPDAESALQDIAYFFPARGQGGGRLPLSPALSNCTLCVVKPHAVREGQLGAALQLVAAGGFRVTALAMFVVENVNVEEFLEVYKGIVPEYQGMVEELASGPCVAMELVAAEPGVNTAVAFRKLAGPSDPEVARLLRPHTLRARLGRDKVRNAVHCSDLPEDGLLEVEYFFKILEM